MRLRSTECGRSTRSESQQKRRPKSPSRCACLRESGSHRLDRSRQAALVARGLVLVDDVLVRDAVDGAHRGAENRLRCSLVAIGDGLTHGLDGGTQTRAKAGVVAAGLDGLAGALAGLCRVGHVMFFRVDGFYETRHVTPTCGDLQATRHTPGSLKLEAGR